MSQYVMMSAATAIARPRLSAYLRAPVAPASTWAEDDWTGLCEAWNDGDVRRRYRAELAGAVRECDRWIGGDYAGLLRGLDGDGCLTAGFDEASGSLTLDFEARVDFRLPTLVWAFTALRGMTAFMAGDDGGLLTATVDWSDDRVLMHLAPKRSSFLDGSRDAEALSRARDAAFDVRCAAEDGEAGSATELIGRLLED
ncbi:hypothetical protein [Kitasatospora sp. NPDC002965]|uniref:hypothetical protein n=1 Tax=Kitasatospora sp. NPDC002965 TaxID=3154775 RepID=UPI0033B91976